MANRCFPTLPTISTVALPHGDQAQFYLDPGRSGVNQAHLFLTGPDADSIMPTLEGSHAGAPYQSFRQYRDSPGHFIAVVVLSSGAWRFRITSTVRGSASHFTVDRVIP